MSNNFYPSLNSSISIGSKVAKNRVWMTAHATLLVKDHLFTSAHIAYYSARARGGVGVITMEAMAVHPTTQPYKGKAFAFDPRMITEYRKLSDAVHKYDTLLLSQPWHRGRQTNSVTNGLPVWAPSPIPCSVYREMPHIMTIDNINEIIDGYRLSAKYSREGGLDGVEVHGASHGYLLNQFLSPATNHRNDIYGGSLDNRMRLICEVLEVTREEVGPNMIVGMRINSNDGHDGGLSTNDWIEIAKKIQKTGLVDYLSVSHGTYLNRMLIYPTSPEKHGYQLDATSKIKAAVDLPVVGVGRITNPDEAEKWLKEKKCDFIGMARSLVADSNWVEKALTGNSNKIRPCVGANWCMSKIFSQSSIGCIHNPFAGIEEQFDENVLQTAKTPKNVAVVGGGPGGMRAAWTLSRRGHKVTLFESKSELGGQVRWWAKAESRKELLGIVDWLSDRVTEENIKLNLSTNFTANDIIGFDSAVIATGSYGIKHGWSMLNPVKWKEEPLEGTDLPHVFSYTELFENNPKVPNKVLLFDTMGSRQGVVTAEYLSQRGALVNFVTQLSQHSPDLNSSRDWSKVHGMLKNKGVNFYVDSVLDEIKKNEVQIKDIYTQKTTIFNNIEMVVLIQGSVSNDTLFHKLNKKIDCHLIGDALAGRRVNDAIYEGELIARYL